MRVDRASPPPGVEAEIVRRVWSGADHEGTATTSACGDYRYELTRRWAPGPVAVMVGLYPSTADYRADYPITRRCMGFARMWGCDGDRVGREAARGDGYI